MSYYKQQVSVNSLFITYSTTASRVGYLELLEQSPTSESLWKRKYMVRLSNIRSILACIVHIVLGCEEAIFVDIQ